MSTDLQKKLVEAIIINGRLPLRKRKNKKELLTSVGYGRLVAKKRPGEIIEAKGVKDALREAGLTEDLITQALVEDIKAKPKNRLGEMRLGAEILQMTDGKPKGNTFNTIIFADEQQREIARRLLASQTEGDPTPDRFSDSNQSEVSK